MGLDEIDKNLKKIKKKSISVTIDPKIDEDFTKLAKSMQVSKSKIIEQLIIVYMDNKKSLFRGEN
jgi:predicted transcriptional regulator